MSGDRRTDVGLDSTHAAAPRADLATQEASTLPPSTAATATPLPRVAAGRYQRGAEIGRGGLGRVVEARDRVLDRTVAIKEQLGGGGASSARFVREALVTARLQHPSIVPVYDAARWADDAPFYAMKRVAGRPLSAAIDAARTPTERLALLPSVLAVADAMAYAHSQRIIHRDLKPANVLLGDFGETVVIDWGLAKDLAADDGDPDGAGAYRWVAASTETVAGAVLGTPAYMAPEQAAGVDVDERADVYALGAMLYHTLTGAVPHQGSSLDEVLGGVIDGSAVRPLVSRDGIPPDLAAIVGKAMARDPAARYRDARDLADDLRRYQTGQLVAAHDYTVGQRLRRWIRRHRAVTAVAAIAALVLLAFGAWTIPRILAETARADRERDQARALAARNQRLADETAAALRDEQVQRGRAEVQTQLAKAFIVNQLHQHLAVCRMAGEAAVARDAAEARHAIAAMEPQGTLVASPELATAIRALDQLVRGWEHGDTPDRGALEQTALAVPMAASAAWQRLTAVAIGDDGRDLEPLVLAIEREHIATPLLARARAAVAGLLDPDAARAAAAAHDFWLLYWGELTFIESDRLGGKPVEHAMVRIGRVLTGEDRDTPLATLRDQLEVAAAGVLAPPARRAPPP
ncbi:MAG: serine/threonine protein kinase [Kofleriaceae bacterium]|nr:serine/threonine protein kinase [Kofleriaceae bacterium]